MKFFIPFLLILTLVSFTVAAQKSKTKNGTGLDSLTSIRLIDSLKQKIKEQQIASSGSDKKMKNVRDSLANYKKDLDFITNRFKEVETELKALKAKKDDSENVKKQAAVNLTVVETQKTEIARLTGLLTNLPRLTKQKDSAITELGNLTRQIGDLKNNVANLQKQISELETIKKDKDNLSQFIISGYDTEVKSAITNIDPNNPNQFKSLLQRGNELKTKFPGNTAFDSNLSLLENYDRGVLLIAKGKKHLDEVYNDQAIAATINELGKLNVNALNNNIKSALENIKGLLSQYCQMDKIYAEKMFDAASSSSIGDFNRAKSKANEASEIVLEIFSYLKRDVREQLALINSGKKLAADQLKRYETRKNKPCN